MWRRAPLVARRLSSVCPSTPHVVFLRHLSSKGTPTVGGVLDVMQKEHHKGSGTTTSSGSGSTTPQVTNDEELQPQWKGLESRMLRKRTKAKGYGGPEGRTSRNTSAWDAESV